MALGILRRLPLRALSRAAGRLAERPLPGPLQRAEIRLFGTAVGVDFAEAALPVSAYPSLQAFFTRPLRKGARPIDPAPEAVVAPCDGAWGAAGRVRRGELLQVKGRPYSLGALLGSDTRAADFEGGAFATFYLAPRDYHRFHMPCDARVVAATHLPGSLWPVNRLGVEGVPGLFAENQRIAARFELASGAALAIVAVGATLVGRVRVVFDDLQTGRGDPRGERVYPAPGLRLAKGEEWGRFEFGSSLVLVAAPGALRLQAEEPGTPLRLGRRIGTLG
jgi:phosphatidylserine decarboxylase